jgi:hypothetical protein
MVENGYLEFELPGDADVQIAWKTETGRGANAERNGAAHRSGARKRNRGAKSRR